MKLTAFTALATLAVGSACARTQAEEHDHGAEPVSAMAASAQGTALPGSALTVASRLQSSPRHSEWAMVRTPAGDSVRAWVVYPERSTNAPVVLVVHEIFGLSSWVRGVADQMAAAGFIAIAPDLLTGKAPLEGDSLPTAVAQTAIRTLRPDDVHRHLEAVAQYGMNLPAAAKRYGIVGFCWGGSTSFAHAVRSPAGLGASVVYYGGSPDTTELSRVRVPVLGLYAGDDQRINARIPATDSVMKRLGKSFEPHFFAGAGHGFLRQQEGREGANQRASDAAWPMTVAFFRKHLGR
ncbi:MAG TPA: dienelactone hydrolase family protein [Gemmatimonadaceae bacterium]|nr:dienelactone hydrolase family protein [Gemmatimonadaceae bacterium]